MADVNHKNLTGANIHEPKGLSSVSASGYTYASDGAGSGVWAAPTLAILDTTGEPAGQIARTDGSGGAEWVEAGGAVYGEMQIVNNTTVLPLTGVADPTFNTDSQYTHIDTGLWVTGLVAGVTFSSSGYLEIVTPGLYEVSTWMSLSIAAVGTNLLAIKYSIDNTTGTLSPRKLKRQSNNSGDIGSIGASGFAELTAGAKVSLFAASDAAGSNDVTIHDAGLTVTLLAAA